MYEKRGLEITAIDAEPLALARACTPALAATGMTAILDMSWGPASLSLIHQGIVTFNRRIPDGAMGPLHASLGTTLGLEHDVIEYLLDEESSGTATSNEQSAPMPDVGSRLISSFVDAVVKELSLSFNYASNQYPHAEVSKLLLVGGGASMKDLATCLAALLKIEVVRVSPAELAACEPAMLSLCASPAMTLAFGLALRALA